MSSTNPSPLRWGILACGKIARKLAEAVNESPTATLAAVASRSPDKAEAFAKETGAARAHGSYEALLDDPEVDAVYIATPHPFHAEWAIKAAQAGKHILCEKPATLNRGQAEAVIEAVQVNNVFFLEAFMYRCHPQAAKLVELVRDKAIGELRVIEASFAFDQGPNFEGRLQSNALGGGGILDVGCYPVSMARLLAGAAQDKPFAEPLELKGVGHLDETTGVDTWASAVARFDGDIIARLSTGVRLREDNVVRLFGSAGKITVTSPWFSYGDVIVETYDDREKTVMTFGHDVHLYRHQVEALARHLEDGEAPSPAMSHADTLGNMRTLDWWRRELNFAYEEEKEKGSLPVVHGQPLRSGDGPIPKIDYAPLGRPVSQLVLGTVGFPDLAHGAAFFDAFFEQGGNCFDDASVYRRFNANPGLCGRWMEKRGVREQCVLIDKGAHTPWCYPQPMTQEVEISLEKHQTAYFDIYMMHRDNPEVPVGEFVDVLHGLIEKGYARSYGLSNWSIERLEAAITYAKDKGLQPPTSLSNNFSLARMVTPVWAGCISASTPDFRAWLADTQLPLFAWSSQARGFFTDRSAPDNLSDRWLSNNWYSDDNFERKRRAYELAQKKDVLPINIALAWVLQQPFPVFPLIGPQHLSEIRTSLPGLTVDLTEEESCWLNLEE